MKKFRMKKYLIILLLLIIFAYYGNLPDYQIYNSNIISAGTCQTVTINTIVYKSHYNPVLYEMIVENYMRVNGTPTNLIIKLFNSKNAIKKGHKPYKTLLYEFG